MSLFYRFHRVNADRHAEDEFAFAVGSNRCTVGQGLYPAVDFKRTAFDRIRPAFVNDFSAYCEGRYVREIGCVVHHGRRADVAQLACGVETVYAQGRNNGVACAFAAKGNAFDLIVAVVVGNGFQRQLVGSVGDRTVARERVGGGMVAVIHRTRAAHVECIARQFVVESPVAFQPAFIADEDTAVVARDFRFAQRTVPKAHFVDIAFHFVSEADFAAGRRLGACRVVGKRRIFKRNTVGILVANRMDFQVVALARQGNVGITVGGNNFRFTGGSQVGVNLITALNCRHANSVTAYIADGYRSGIGYLGIYPKL